MKKAFLIIILALFVFSACGGKTGKENTKEQKSGSENVVEEYIKADVYETNDGSLKVTLVGHGSLMFEYKGKVIHVDPYSKVADYTKLPQADLILITHEHGDHLDTAVINVLKKEGTDFIVSKVVNEILGYGDVMSNGDNTTCEGISIQAVPAYNIVSKKPDGEAYHPKGRGNGYILVFGDKKVYIAADTENIPEMDALKGTIDIAFMPKNLPYTMSDDMFIDAAKKVTPKVLYPYHMSEFDNEKIGKALEDTGIKIEVRPMKNI
ncbi:MAG: MBL fold metallo-hydrolase [Prevotella sp.]|jgi:L-ascorbate metabolism protein UlaG (beta-lactamase superfamily)|nr:MBL fold metallo-hydrolase [Prevotella sp.]